MQFGVDPMRPLLEDHARDIQQRVGLFDPLNIPFSQPPATPVTPTTSAPDALAQAASEAGVTPASSGDAAAAGGTSTLQLADGTVLDPSAVAVTDGSDIAVRNENMTL